MNAPSWFKVHIWMYLANFKHKCECIQLISSSNVNAPNWYQLQMWMHPADIRFICECTQLISATHVNAPNWYQVHMWMHPVDISYKCECTQLISGSNVNAPIWHHVVEVSAGSAGCHWGSIHHQINYWRRSWSFFYILYGIQKAFSMIFGGGGWDREWSFRS